jgi:hypothetical protein
MGKPGVMQDPSAANCFSRSRAAYPSDYTLCPCTVSDALEKNLGPINVRDSRQGTRGLFYYPETWGVQQLIEPFTESSPLR